MWLYLRSSVLFWMGVVWAAVGTGIVAGGAFWFLTEKNIIDHGVRTGAIVTDKQMRRNSKGHKSYYLTYRFEDSAGGEHSRRQSVSHGEWERTGQGAEAGVIYLQKSPETSRLVIAEGSAWWTDPAILMGVGGIFGLVGYVLFGIGIGRTRRQIYLLLNGMPIMAEVTGIHPNLSVGVNGRHPKFLTYRFTAPDGAAIEGRTIDLPRKIEDKWSPGDTILVAYDRLNPQENAADILGVRQGSIRSGFAG